MGEQDIPELLPDTYEQGPSNSAHMMLDELVTKHKIEIPPKKELFVKREWS